MNNGNEDSAVIALNGLNLPPVPNKPEKGVRLFFD